MDNDTKKATATTASETEERREIPSIFGFKNKRTDDTDHNSFSVNFDKDTRVINLIVNGKEYQSYKCRDHLSGSIKFHDAINVVLRKFSDWSLYGDIN